MARFTPVDDADKEVMKARALKQKPNVKNVVATEKGWAVPHNNGTLELLVSFAGLDALLGDLSTDQDKEAEPVVVEPEAVEETTAEPVKKKGGRPKKVDSVESTETTTEDKAAE